MRFLHVRNLENRVPVQAGARFLQNCVFRVGWEKASKNMSKSTDFEVKNREKSMRKRIKKTNIF